MGKTITTRLPDNFVGIIKDIAEKEKVDLSTAIRKLLAEAIKEWKKEYAVEQYRKGEFSFGQTAKFAGISPWDLPDLFKQKKVLINYDEEELEADLKILK